MTPAFLTTPTPHGEAVNLIRNKPAVARDIYDAMPQEFRGRAFTITGIEAFDVLQAVQDKIATLPAGADWKKLRKEIAADISPWLGEEEGKRRAKLLLNHHGRAAYASTNARITHAQEDVFPFLMYRSSRTSKESRESHAALDGLILPSNHPFWDTHTPPSDFGCNCLDPIPMTAEDVDEERKNDAAAREENRRVASPAQLTALENGTLVRGPGLVFDIRTPREQSGGAGGYETNWRDTTLPYDEIKKRWSPEVAAAFEAWASKQDIDGVSLLDSLLNPRPFREATRRDAPGGLPAYLDLAAGVLAGRSFATTKQGMVYSMAAVDAAKVTSFEERVRERRLEHGLAFDANGNTIWQDVGKPAEIEVPANINLEGLGFTHNHPQGKSFSPEDLTLLYQRRLGELRAATHHGDFRALRKPGVRISQIEGRMDAIMPDVLATLRASNQDSGFDLNKADDLMCRALAREGLIDYEYIPNDQIRPNPMESDSPIPEALSAKPASGNKLGPARFISHSEQEYRDWLDGKAEYPGMAALRAAARLERETEAEATA